MLTADVYIYTNLISLRFTNRKNLSKKFSFLKRPSFFRNQLEVCVPPISVPWSLPLNSFVNWFSLTYPCRQLGIFQKEDRWCKFLRFDVMMPSFNFLFINLKEEKNRSENLESSQVRKDYLWIVWEYKNQGCQVPKNSNCQIWPRAVLK